MEETQQENVVEKDEEETENEPTADVPPLVALVVEYCGGIYFQIIFGFFCYLVIFLILYGATQCAGCLLIFASLDLPSRSANRG